MNYCGFINDHCRHITSCFFFLIKKGGNLQKMTLKRKKRKVIFPQNHENYNLLGRVQEGGGGYVSITFPLSLLIFPTFTLTLTPPLPPSSAMLRVCPLNVRGFRCWVIHKYKCSLLCNIFKITQYLIEYRKHLWPQLNVSLQLPNLVKQRNIMPTYITINETTVYL